MLTVYSLANKVCFIYQNEQFKKNTNKTKAVNSRILFFVR
jgi:hypothetical protein